MATELAKAYVQLVPSAKGLKGAITKELDPVGGSAGKSFVSKFKGAIAVGAIGVALKKSIEEGAQFEQLAGGVEKLFGKDTAKTIQEYATNAFKTSQMSANTYMSLVTSFSASLISSLNGDTAKSAKIADMAIRDMSDNASVFGSSMEDVQNAYRGFAKQNYTMLDNLKLGYGGTKTEMERLLKDAEKITGIHYDINNLADVYSAIHVIQGELNITGNTAKEASQTIEGSMNMLKGAFSNFLASLSTGGDVATATQNLVESGTAVINNLIPALGQILQGLLPALGVFIIQGVPQLLTSLGDALTNVATNFQNAVDNMSTEGAGKFVLSFIVGLAKSIPKILVALGDIVVAMSQYLIKAIAGLGKSVANKIKSWFPINIGKMLNLKLPHFKLTGKFSLKDMTVPKLSVNWYKTGGIFNDPSIIGVGEAGAEAVIPLDKLQDYTGSDINPAVLAEALAKALQTTETTVIVQVDKDVLVKTTAPLFKKEIKHTVINESGIESLHTILTSAHGMQKIVINVVCLQLPERFHAQNYTTSPH